MNISTKMAYQKISGHEPDPILQDWQLAQYVLDNFNYNLLGEDLAKKFVFEVTNYLIFPDEETTKKIVSRAESLAEEMGIVAEGHMADIERAGESD
ncbi:MAG: hypothetical protein PHW50_03415, partial [Patescibacteria group bacterium]|nr:hypothetical protein [Patescibacteria group bacterium]